MKILFWNTYNKKYMIDFIGDIHGHADKLKAMLKKLGYSINYGCYSHPERRVLFIGDYIDRGPKIRETLSIVKAMVDSENAMALMGNHEYNAICYHSATPFGHLREHSIKNKSQHYKTLEEFKNKHSEYNNYIQWFKTMPLFFETDEFRAVHACWDANSINYLKGTLLNGRLTEKLIYQSAIKGSRLYDAIDVTLKGKEIRLPNDLSFADKDGNKRTDIRIKWWEDASQLSYQEICAGLNENVPAKPINKSVSKKLEFYAEIDKPVFFGHYWLEGKPALFRENICCLDYSVANKGHLVAYRSDGEAVLRESKLVSV